MNDYVQSLVYAPRVLHGVSQIPITSSALDFAVGENCPFHMARCFLIGLAVKPGRSAFRLVSAQSLLAVVL